MSAQAATEARVDELLDVLLATHDPAGDPVAFLGAQFDAGLAFVHFPVGRGGLGASRSLQRGVEDRVAEAGGPSALARNPLGVGMGAPTLLAHGTPAQVDRLLRPLFTGEEVWCQLFSEPGAGSDVASLATRAERDGDEWVVNGQKVWTTVAHVARWAMLLARTDPEERKHQGLTYFVLDMRAPGVEVRPLRQMTGDAEFNEVYLTDVRVPDDARLGEVGDGWRVALTTLMNERVSLGVSAPPGGSGPIVEALRVWRSRRERPAVERDALARLWIEAEVIRMTNLRAAQSASGTTPGPEGSICKLLSAEHNKRVTELTVHLLGGEGMLYGSYEMRRPDHGMSFDFPQQAFLRARANSIEGGTSEIMRNILGERVLGLPRDVRLDKDRPWSQVPRSS